MLTRLLSTYTQEESPEDRDRMRWATGTLFAGKHICKPSYDVSLLTAIDKAGTDTVTTF
jgi:hypothetical protein